MHWLPNTAPNVECGWRIGRIGRARVMSAAPAGRTCEAVEGRCYFENAAPFRLA